jgi:NAD(P)-dependent dehydrogenase (short-subunit alcohol dehydrogenase family)
VVVGCGLRVDDAEATVEVVRAAGGTMVSLQPCDLSKPAQCQALVDFAVRTFDRIDVHRMPPAKAFVIRNIESRLTE